MAFRNQLEEYAEKLTEVAVFFERFITTQDIEATMTKETYESFKKECNLIIEYYQELVEYIKKEMKSQNIDIDKAIRPEHD